jgi:hypothetical protein
MNTIGISISIILIFMTVFSPRKWAAIGITLSVCYLTQGEFLSLGGVNLYAIRIIIYIGFIRVMIRREFLFSEINKIDLILIIYLLLSTIIFIIRVQLYPGYESTLLMYKIGSLIDALAAYFTFRGLLNNVEIFKEYIKYIPLVILPLSIFMLVESFTGRNLFSAMGGVPEISVFRGGYFRSKGAFMHSITAGTVGATLAPLFIFLFSSTSGYFFAIAGIVLSLLITIASHSSGPLLAFITGACAILVWPFRERMRIIRWGIVIFFILLHLTMGRPVWFIFDILSGFLGGDGWHRANLIDKFVNNFSEWWLIGMSIEKTENWAATMMPWGGVDITNQYISLGVGSGLFSLILLILVFKFCFSALGKSMKNIREFLGYEGKQDELLLWCLGSALFSHVVNISAVTYFDQSNVMFYMLLALISSISWQYINNIKILSQ